MASETYGLEDSAGAAQEQAIFLCRSYLVHRGLKVEDSMWQSSEVAPVIVAEDDGETVLIDVRAAKAEDSETVPELHISEHDIRTMRRSCLSYLLEHEDTESIHHDVCAVSIVGERHARIRHLVAVCRWDGDC